MAKTYAERMQEARTAIVAKYYGRSPEDVRAYATSYGNGGPVWGSSHQWGVYAGRVAGAVVGSGGGGGGNGSWAVASGGNGQGGQGYASPLDPCRCGQQATRANSAQAFCASCGPLPSTGMGRADCSRRSQGFQLCKCSVDCINQTKAYQSQQPAPAAPVLVPDPTHCPCGAELMGSLAKKVNLKCGDCAMAEFADAPHAPLDTRIKAAAKPDPDPTSGYVAWASPSWES